MKNKITTYLVISFFTLSTLGFLVIDKAEAQSSKVQVCFNNSTGEIKKPSQAGKCDSASEVSLKTFDADASTSFCTSKVNQPIVGNTWSLRVADLENQTTGKYSCKAGETGPVTYRSLAVTGSSTQPTPSPNPTTTTGGSTTTTKPNNTTTKPGSGATTNTPSTGDQICETGFEKVGPLCIPKNQSGSGSTTFAELASKVIKALLYFAGIVAVGFIILGGYQIMTAQGVEAKATEGRKTLTNAIIGLVIVILSFAIVQAILSFVIKG